MRQLIDRRRKSVLIVECDIAELSQGSLDIGKTVGSVFRLTYPRNPVVIVSTTTEALLLEKFSELAADGAHFSHVILIGHSNAKVLRLCSDRTTSWQSVATWFERFSPTKIFLIGCDAGRWLPCCALFKGIESLQEIYGSPLPVDKIQSGSIILMVLHSLGARKIDKGFLRGVQFLGLLATKGLMFRRTRKQYSKSDDVYGEMWSIGEQALQSIMNN